MVDGYPGDSREDGFGQAHADAYDAAHRQGRRFDGDVGHHVSPGDLITLPYWHGSFIYLGTDQHRFLVMVNDGSSRVINVWDIYFDKPISRLEDADG